MDANAHNSETPVLIREEPIELCQLLKLGGFVDSGGEAKQVIGQGLVRLNGSVEMQKRKKVMVGDRVVYAGKTLIVQLR